MTTQSNHGRHIEIVTCRYMSQQWLSLIRQGYHTALRDEAEPYIAVMWRGNAARDYVRNVMPEDLANGKA